MKPASKTLSRNNSQHKTENRRSWLAVAGGVTGGVAASSCCIVPLVLFWAGVSGAWIGTLTALAPYQPYFIAGAGLFVGAGFYFVYSPKQKTCGGDAVCGHSLSDKALKISLWLATLLIIVAGLFPYVAPTFLGLS